MTIRAGVAGLALLAGCVDQVSLGDPDGAASGPASEAPVACAQVAHSNAAPIADLAASWGELRALAVTPRIVYLLFAEGPTAAGILARVDLAGGLVSEVARVGTQPAALAVDGAHVYVGAGSGEVFRVDARGVFTLVQNDAPVTAVTSNGRGSAYFTLATGAVLTTDFGAGTPRWVAEIPNANALTFRSGTLYVAAAGSVSAIALAGPHAVSPRRLVDRCGFGAIAAQEDHVYCADVSEILRIASADGRVTSLASAQSGPRDVGIAAGRLFWMTTVSPTQRYVMARPLDGTGGETVAGVADGSLFAVDRCGLVFASGRALFRRDL